MCVSIFSFDGLMNLYLLPRFIFRGVDHKFKQNPTNRQYKNSHFYHLEVISRVFLQFERFLGAMGGYAAEAWGEAL